MDYNPMDYKLVYKLFEKSNDYEFLFIYRLIQIIKW